jgi:Lar family restriction alleviation protein
MSEALVPCPFCGGHYLKPYAYGLATPDADCYIQCQGCTTCGPSAKTPERAVELWNHRPDDETVKLRLAVYSLKRQIENYWKATPHDDDK